MVQGPINGLSSAILLRFHVSHKFTYLVSYSICQFLCSLQRIKSLENKAQARMIIVEN